MLAAKTTSPMMEVSYPPAIKKLPGVELVYLHEAGKSPGDKREEIIQKQTSKLTHKQLLRQQPFRQQLHSMPAINS